MLQGEIPSAYVCSKPLDRLVPPFVPGQSHASKLVVASAVQLVMTFIGVDYFPCPVAAASVRSLYTGHVLVLTGYICMPVVLYINMNNAVVVPSQFRWTVGTPAFGMLYVVQGSLRANHEMPLGRMIST